MYKLKKEKSTMLIMVIVVFGIGCSMNNEPVPEYYNSADIEFMAKASAINLGEVEAGNIAMQKGMHAAVVNYGNMMVLDHSSAQAELKSIVEPRGRTLPSEPDAEQKHIAQVLSGPSGDAFDSTYLYTMVEGHDKAILLHQAEVEQGADEALKAFAAGKLVVIKHHKHLADSIAHALYP